MKKLGNKKSPKSFINRQEPARTPNSHHRPPIILCWFYVNYNHTPQILALFLRTLVVYHNMLTAMGTPVMVAVVGLATGVSAGESNRKNIVNFNFVFFFVFLFVCTCNARLDWVTGYEELWSKHSIFWCEDNIHSNTSTPMMLHCLSFSDRLCFAVYVCVYLLSVRFSLSCLCVSLAVLIFLFHGVYSRPHLSMLVAVGLSR